MSNIFKNYKNILILALIAVVVLMRIFQPESVDLKEYIKIGGKKYELLSKKVDTVLVKVHDTTIVYKPKWRTKIEKEIVEVIIPADIDTLAILKDYYSQYSYIDTVAVKTYGNGMISDVVTQNKIVSRQIVWDLDIPIIKETIIAKELPKTQLYIGGSIGFETTNFINNASLGLLLKTKTDRIYGLNIGLANVYDNSIRANTLTPYISGSIYWKISFNKKR